jgi:cytidylate kinase
VSNVAAADGLSRAEARRKIESEEAERRAFLERHFHAGLGDSETFDLVVNTDVLGIEGAVEAIKATLPVVVANRHAA